MPNKEKEKVKGPNRYPLKNHEVAKRTIARLTRDVIHGKIEPEKFRAAIYGINTLISIFKIEAPIKQSIEFAGALRCEAKLTTPEERKAELEKLEAELKELMYGCDTVNLLESPLERAAELKAVEVLPEPELAKARTGVEDTDALWQPAGIGAKRR